MVTLPSSSGWRRVSSTSRRNSGNSSRNRTPRCASVISPGTGSRPAAPEPPSHRVGRGIMMRCTEPPFGTLDRLLSSADGRPDTDNLQPFAVRQRRQDGGKALCSHALARTGRSGKKHVVSACSRDLERAFDRVLTEHMQQNPSASSCGSGHGRRSTRRERLSAVQMSEQLI